MDAGDIGHGIDYARAARLLSQLPAGSKYAGAVDPNLSWSDTQQLLASIDYSLKWLVWSRTKEGEHNRNQPKPLKPPAVEQAEASKVEGTDLAGIDEILGGI